MLSIEDKAAIDDVLLEYVRAMDYGDIDAVVATFTADGEILDVTKTSWNAKTGGVRGFAVKWLPQPFMLNGQHWLQRVKTDILPDGTVQLLSYWSWIHWEPAKPQPAIHMLGTYLDQCVKSGGKWLICKKTIGAWRSGAPAGI